MKEQEVITALQIGLQEAVDLLKLFEGIVNEQGPVNPIYQHKIEQLEQLLIYSQHLTTGHPLYDA